MTSLKDLEDEVARLASKLGGFIDTYQAEKAENKKMLEEITSNTEGPTQADIDALTQRMQSMEKNIDDAITGAATPATPASEEKSPASGTSEEEVEG